MIDFRLYEVSQLILFFIELTDLRQHFCKMFFHLHYVLAVVGILSRHCYRKVLLKIIQLAMEAISNLLQGVLHFIYSDFVFKRLFSPILQVFRACVQLMLNLAYNIVFDSCLSLA